MSGRVTEIGLTDARCLLPGMAVADAGDYVEYDVELHATADTVLPIGTEVEVFFDGEMWERAVVSGHRADIVARDNVHHHHIFQYERHNRALMHPRGSILLRVTRSVHDALKAQRNGSRGGICAVEGMGVGRRKARR